MTVIRIASPVYALFVFTPPPLYSPRPLDRYVRRASFIFDQPFNAANPTCNPDMGFNLSRLVNPSIRSHSLKPSTSECPNHLEKTIDLSGVCLTWLGPSLKWERPPYEAIEVHRDPCKEPYMGGKGFIWHPAVGHVWHTKYTQSLNLLSWSELSINKIVNPEIASYSNLPFIFWTGFLHSLFTNFVFILCLLFPKVSQDLLNCELDIVPPQFPFVPHSFCLLKPSV